MPRRSVTYATKERTSPMELPGPVSTDQVSPVPIRYMGTKRPIAPRVRRLVDDLEPEGRVVDLFCGMGSVASCLAPRYPVIANDALEFAGALARARFTTQTRTPLAEVLPRLRSVYRDHLERLTRAYRRRVRTETAVLEGGWKDLAQYMAGAPHAGNSVRWAKAARDAHVLRGAARYCLTTLYFSAGYFSTRQALALDAIRRAIDQAPHDDRDWLLSAWLSSAATVINAPGHTAQYLKPNDANSYSRIRRAWRRDVWETFKSRLADVGPVGTCAWRRRNEVHTSDAVHLLQGKLRRVGLVYADPPYTKDHYSRYYHVYETLYRYDFPNSSGAGRYRADRFRTQFSLATRVRPVFDTLLGALRRYKVPLILSYPDDGLLVKTGTDVRTLLQTYYGSVTVEQFAAQHSTLGASKGTQQKGAKENLYVCIPG